MNNQVSNNDFQSQMLEQMKMLNEKMGKLEEENSILKSERAQDLLDAQEYENRRYINRFKKIVKDQAREFVHDSNEVIDTMREALYEKPKAKVVEISDKTLEQYSNAKESTLKTARTIRNDAIIVTELTKEYVIEKKEQIQTFAVDTKEYVNDKKEQVKAFAVDKKEQVVKTAHDVKENVIAASDKIVNGTGKANAYVIAATQLISIELTGPIANHARKQAKELGSGVSERYSKMESIMTAKVLTSVKALSKAKDALKEFASRSSNSVKDSVNSLSDKVSKENSAFWKKMGERFNVYLNEALGKHNEKVAQKSADRSLGR